MQYLLTREEFLDLRQKAENNLEITKEQLQTLCTRIANEMPVKWEGWDKDRPIAPWGCYLSMETEWYCDNCPVSEICPAPKHWSK